jgi:protein-S-isoprenylcysteine O-methyltransferase Ste14
MHVNIKLLVVQTVGLFLVFALALFLSAGTIAWLAGWIFLGLFFGFFLFVNAWLFRHNPGLLQERTRFLGTSDQQGWDKMLYALLWVFSVAWLIFMALDAVRFHWLQVPLWLQVGGVAILLCSFYLLFLVLRENSYLSPVVRVQKERAQTVISTGPYHYVRHPMYSAIAIFVVGTALLLGSWYGLVFGLFLVVVLAWRAVLEERTLRRELPGYIDYMKQVKYRLIPYIW